MAVGLPNPLTRNEWLWVAKRAKETRNYHQMARFMQNLVLRCSSTGEDLNAEERSLLAAAYKHVIGPLRDARLNDERNKLRIENEISVMCASMLILLENHLLPSAVENESRVFYMKMKGDYHRYLAEFKVGQDRQRAAEEAMAAYRAAEKIASADLDPAHPTRLGLALNVGVLYAEILGDYETARLVVRGAFEELPDDLDTCCEDSKLVMELLRDNLKLWTMNSEVMSSYYN